MRFLSGICLLLLLSAAGGYAQQRQLFFKHFTVDQGLPSNEVYRILEDTSGYLWITTDRGIVRYDGYSFEEMPVAGMPEVFPWFGLKQEASGAIYFIGYKGYMAVYRNDHLSAYPHNDKAALLGADYMTASEFQVRKDSVWIGYVDKGVFLITPEGKVLIHNTVPGVHCNLREKLFYTLLGKNYIPGTKVPVYITWGNGTVSLDSISYPIEKGSGVLQHERVNGLDLICIGRSILFYKDGRKQAEFILQSNMYALCVLDERHIAIGYSKGGVGLYELKGTSLHGPLETWLPGLSVTKILRDVQGGLWFATRESGLFYANPPQVSYWEGQGAVHSVERQHDTVFAVYQSGLVQAFSRGRRLFSKTITFPVPDTTTVQDGVVTNIMYAQVPRYGYIRKRLQEVDEQYNIHARRVTSVSVDTTGRIWIGTYEGLFVYTGDTLMPCSDMNPVFSDRIVAIKELPNHTLAIATLGNGLALYRDNKVHVLNKKNGLPTSIINDIEVDGDTVWLATNKGLVKVAFVEKHFYVWHYGSSYGLPTLDIHMLRIADGWIYFKWINRLVMIEQNRLRNLAPAGIPHITSVKARDNPVSPVENGVFRYDQSSIKIVYNSVNLASGDRQLYRYRLSGLDDKWSTIRERQVIFTSLPPGTYQFDLQVADAQGIFLPHTATYRFEIKPAFWQQWWFPFAIGLLLLFVAFLYYRMRLRVVKRNNQMKLDLAENQQKALVQLINPHFIFNVLNTAQAAILKEDKMNAASIISRFAKLMRLSLELSRERFVHLDQEVEFLKRYIDLEIIRTPGKFTSAIVVAGEIDTTTVRIPSMLVQPFVENAIKHGIMHVTDRIAHIQLTFEREGNIILCTVDDNGVGRERSASINASRLRKHHSVGVEIICRRLELLHREKNAEYRYFVKDKYDEDGLPSGTTVIFSIPFNE